MESVWLWHTVYSMGDLIFQIKKQHKKEVFNELIPETFFKKNMNIKQNHIR